MHCSLRVALGGGIKEEEERWRLKEIHKEGLTGMREERCAGQSSKLKKKVQTRALEL